MKTTQTFYLFLSYPINTLIHLIYYSGDFLHLPLSYFIFNLKISFIYAPKFIICNLKNVFCFKLCIKSGPIWLDSTMVIFYS